MAARAQAQAQVQKQAEITSHESLELVKCLLRVSIYHVSYLRGFFPDSDYKGVDMANLDGMHIKMLLRKKEKGNKETESKMLIDWVEGGVVDALRRKYLRKLFFGFSADPEAKQLLEQYVFSFSYDDADGVRMDLDGKNARGKKFNYNTQGSQQAPQKPDVNTVKYQVIRLMRMLVGVCQTLEKVPDERFLFMKLTYYDYTPEEYEPPFFEAAGERAVGAFPRKPFTMSVGNVGTQHHGVGLQVKSVLDAMDMGEGMQAGEPEMETLSSSEQATTELSDDSAQEQGEESFGGFSPDGAKRGQAANKMQLYTEAQEDEGDAISMAAKAAPAAEVDPAELDKLLAYAMKRSEVHVVDAMSYFMDINSDRLEACFERLVQDKVLERTSDPDTFAVVKAQEMAQDVVARMNSLAVGAAKPAPLPSHIGGVHSAAGTQQTMSAAAAPAPAGKRKGMEDSPAAQNVWIDNSQQDKAGAPAVPKASIGTALIHQLNKKPKKAAAPPSEQRTLRTRNANGGRLASMR